VKPAFGLIAGRAIFTSANALWKEQFSVFIMYAITTEAERETPAWLINMRKSLGKPIITSELRFSRFRLFCKHQYVQNISGDMILIFHFLHPKMEPNDI
jgi:hypothetical protein